jgi:hypothetical protein
MHRAAALEQPLLFALQKEIYFGKWQQAGLL